MKREIIILVIVLSLAYTVSAQFDGDVWELRDRIDELEGEVVPILEEADFDTSGYYAHMDEIDLRLEELDMLWNEERWDEADRLEIELLRREGIILEAMKAVMGVAHGVGTGEIPEEKLPLAFEMGMAFGRGEFPLVLDISNELRIQLGGRETEDKGLLTEPRATRDVDGINWEAVGVILIVFGGGVGWYLKRKKRGHVARYMDEIDQIYSSYKMKTS
jgi:hypothetical protein